MTITGHTLDGATVQRGLGHLMQIRNGQADIRAGWLGYGGVLNEIKAQHSGSNNAFGDAVKAAGLDVWPEGSCNNSLQPIDRPVRSAAMWAAALPPDELAAFEAEHANTEVTAKSGFRGLYASVRRASARTDQHADEHIDQQADNAPEEDEAEAPAAVMPAATAQGEAICQRSYLAGIEAAKAEGFYLDANSLPKSAQDKLEAFKRRELRKLQDAFQRALEDEVDRITTEILIPNYRAKLDHADEIARSHRGVMTKAEYNTIVACLHPDSRLSVSDEKLADAFRILRSKAVPLLPGETTSPDVVPFPRTAAEMRQRREAVRAEKAARAAAQRAA